MTVLEISQKEYPTVLWAPVSKPFPYSILYYTDEAEDKGKLLRKKLAKFEQDYDVDLYSLTNYLDRITAPLQIHQGTADEAVPQKWSDEFIKGFKIKNFPAKRDPALQEKLKISYYLYPGADHNLVGAWDRVVRRDVEFFRRYFGP